MKILITGASGKISRYLINTSLFDHELIGLSRGSQKKFRDSKIEWYQSELTDLDQIRNILNNTKPDVIIHTAAMIGDICEKSKAEALKVNVEFTRKLGEIACEEKVNKFIFFSTSAVYDQKELKPTDELSNIAPINFYGETKLAAEKELELLSMADTKFIVLRLFNIYGPGQDGSLVNKLINSSNLKPVKVYNPEHFYRDYISIEDVGELIKLLIKKEFENNTSIYNVGSGEIYNTYRLIKELKKNGFELNYEVIESNSQEISVSWANIEKARKELNYYPVNDFKIDETIKDFIYHT